MLFFVVFVLGTVLIFNCFHEEAEAPGYKYFNPDIQYPEDPCDTGGISVCYINQD